jgi:hypothetical protein
LRLGRVAALLRARRRFCHRLFVRCLKVRDHPQSLPAIFVPSQKT